MWTLLNTVPSTGGSHIGAYVNLGEVLYVDVFQTTEYQAPWAIRLTVNDNESSGSVSFVGDARFTSKQAAVDEFEQLMDPSNIKSI